MSKAIVHVPIQEKFLRRYQALYLEVLLNVEVLAAQQTFVSLPFLLDTGTPFTTVPIALAQQLGISFTTNKPVWIRGATGSGKIQGFLSPMWILFPALAAWQFSCECCFTPQNLSRPLFSLRDLLLHFTFSTERRTPSTYPGELVLILREDHGGIACG
jgi:hypothetical protein